MGTAVGRSRHTCGEGGDSPAWLLRVPQGYPWGGGVERELGGVDPEPGLGVSLRNRVR